MGTAVIQRNRVARRVRRSPQEWRELFEDYARSGESRRGFCARNDIARSTFDWWQRRVRAQGRGVEPALSDDPDGRALFVELTHPAAARVEQAPRPWDVELTLGAGIVLRLRTGSPIC